MKSIVLTEEGLKLEEKEIYTTNRNTKVRLHYASLNHRDLWILKGQYAGIKYPIIPGSDGAGIYENKEVVLNPSINWEHNIKNQPKNYEIIGLPGDGTFQQEAYFSENLINNKPEHLDLKEASCIPLAGLTAYRVLFTRCGLQSNDKVLIVGAGGGVALFALQFAIAIDCEVWVTSGKEDKINKAVKLGAVGGVNYHTHEWHKELANKAEGFDVIIDSTGGSQFSLLTSLAKPGGRIGIYGGTLGKIQDLSPQVIFWKQLSIFGSTMGNHDEFKDMLAFVSKHKIHPVIDSVYKMEDHQKAFDRMDKGEQFGKIVLDLR